MSMSNTCHKMSWMAIFIVSSFDIDRLYVNGGHRRARSQSGTGVPHSISEPNAKYPCRKLKFGVRYSRTALVLATPVAIKLAKL